LHSLDVRDNELSDLSAALDVLRRLPLLRELDLRGNPLAKSWGADRHWESVAASAENLTR